MCWRPGLTAPADPARARPSLLHRLLRDVMVPLALTWAVGTAVMIGGLEGGDDSALIDVTAAVTDVRLEVVS